MSASSTSQAAAGAAVDDTVLEVSAPPVAKFILPAVGGIGGGEFEFPIVVGSEDEVAINITTLRGTTGAITLDPGFANTGSTLSDITFINGEKGILRYCGYPIDDLAALGFEDVLYLLLHRELPTLSQLQGVRTELAQALHLPKRFRQVAKNALPKYAHPMCALQTSVAAMPAYYPHLLDVSQAERATMSLVAAVPVLAAAFYRYSIGKKFIKPEPSYGFAKNFLHMMFGEEASENDEFVKAMNIALILHADHEQNCSTSTARMVGSAGSNLFESIAAAIGALNGPAHGRANFEVMQMLDEIVASGATIESIVARAKDKNDPFKLFGFGHRVYKSADPRATVLQAMCPKVLEAAGDAGNGRHFELAKELEQVAREDVYFIERNLYPNVDFYSGIIYRAMGFPTEMFTVLFAIGRTIGWCAHWIENQGQRINRPRQVYTGHTERNL